MKKPSVLIVDDHQENLMAMRAVLDSPDYDITECTSGKEALQRILTEKFDLILMDVQMPELDGFETAQLIRNRPKCDAIPLIFVTAIMLDDESALKGYDSGCVDYITKPFHPDKLRKKVEFFLSYASKIRQDQHMIDTQSEYGKFMRVFNELVNPLWSVLLNVQLLKKYSKNDKKKTLNTLGKKLEDIEASTKRLQALIDSYKSHVAEFR